MAKKKNKHSNETFTSALLEAEKIYYSNDTARLLTALSKAESKLKSASLDEKQKYDRLLTFAHAFNRNINEAERLCTIGVLSDERPLDYYFILTYLHLSMREFQKAVSASEKYFQLYDNLDSSFNNFTLSENHCSQVYNFRGSAYLELSQFSAAREEFEKSLEIDSGNHLPYINLVNIAIKEQNKSRALEIIEKGCRECRQVQELRLLQESIENKATISACMIVKNEEELLPDCLASIRDWVDEIIVVDTGSTDKTVAIAESFGAKVFHQAWEGNFSKHRNYSLAQATSDWILIIDADERMNEADVSEIERLTTTADVEIISINVFNVYGKNKQLKTYLPSVRFWRRSKNLRYEGIVHNLLKLGKYDAVTRSNIGLKHLGYDLSPEKMQNKFLRTKTLLEEQLKENQDNTFALFNYAQVLKAEGGQYPVKNIPAILEASLRAIELTDPEKSSDKNIHLMCLDQAAWAFFYKGEYDMALEYAERALAIKADYLDPLMLLGSIYARQKKWDEAEQAYLSYLETQAAYDVSSEKDSLILSHIDNRSSAYYSLGLIYESKKDFNRAKQMYHNLLAIDGSFLEANVRLGRLYLQDKNYSQAKQYLSAQMQDGLPTVEAALGLAEVYIGKQDVTKAEEAFKKAMQLDQFDVVPKIAYCRFLTDENRDSEAINLLQSIKAEGKANSEVLKLLGNRYFSVGNYEAAAENYTEYLETSKSSSEILNNLGNCHFNAERYEKAEIFYSQAVAVDDKSSISIRNLGIAQYKNKKLETALKTLRTYKTMNKNDLQIINIISQICMEIGLHKEAVSGFEDILRKHPSDVQTVFNLSECYLIMGHRDSAIIGYKRVIELDPAFAPAIDRLSQIQGSFSPH